MIGNDVIDLTYRSKLFRQFKSARLNQKIFTLDELSQIDVDDTLSSLRRWTMKEAAYKAYQRMCQLKPKFNPCQFHTELIDNTKGSVTIDQYQFYLSSTLNIDYIFSKVDTKAHQTTFSFTSKTNLVNQLTQLFKTKAIYLQKNKHNIPSIHLNYQAKPISLTKHGHYKWATIYTPNC